MQGGSFNVCLARRAVTALAVAAIAGSFLPSYGDTAKPPAAGKPAAKVAKARQTTAPVAPPLAFADPTGKLRALKDYRGRPVVLFFYCGCGLCHKCAQNWAAMQRSGALTAMSPQTLVVFHGDAAEAREFIGATQLDMKQTVVLVDPEGKGSTLYKSEECPRVFVVDPQGRVRYTNNEQGAQSYKIPAPLIVARAVDNLRLATANATHKP